MKISELRAIASRRTAGNWFVEDDFDDPIVKTDAENVPGANEYYGNNIAMLVYDGSSYWTRPSAEADAEFISCAARVFDRLLDCVEGVKEMMDARKELHTLTIEDPDEVADKIQERRWTAEAKIIDALAALEAAEGGGK